MMPNVTIANLPVTLEAARSTILEVALDAGVSFPHGCRSGTCGMCKSRLIAGKVDMDYCDPAALDDTDRAEDFILPCRSRPLTDVTIEWLGEADEFGHPLRKVAARVVGLEPATHDIYRLRLEPRGVPLAFSAGQYALLSFGRLPTRTYSMANRPDDPVLEFHIRCLPNGMASEYVASRLRLGDTVRLKGPYGCAHLRDGLNTPIIAIAGGSGLAPIKSIVTTALAHDPERSVSLYFGVRDEQDIYDEADFLGLAEKHPNFRFMAVLSEPTAATRRRTGWVHNAAAADLPSLAGTQVHLAGPPPMVEAAKATAIARGARPEDVHADAFHAAATDDEPAAVGLLKVVGSLFRRR